MDLYSQLGDELRALFQNLFNEDKEEAVRNQMDKILSLAIKIGGPIEMEAELLYRDVLKFLENPNDEKCISILKEHALKIEQETREL